jgi:nicotinate-nucleotide pyrophosphorylase (carboxylating)
MRIKDIDPIIDAALLEDMPLGDITSENIISLDSVSEAEITAKENGILAGIEVAERVFKKLDPEMDFSMLVGDGSSIGKGEKLALLKGPSITLLKGERTALNFLQRLSGIATATHRFMQELKGSRTEILDTRKTTPGLRILEKYAVKMGGGKNHRFSLSDMVLIKDNHLMIVGSITEAVRRAKSKVSADIKVEVETRSLEEVKEAFSSGADMIMLDNMSLSEMKEAVKWINGRTPLEASGNITIDRLKEIALLGVDFVSAGSLTHSFKSLDISMDFKH